MYYVRYAMYCVLCTICHVLCAMYYVPCTMYHVLCAVCYVLCAVCSVLCAIYCSMCLVHYLPFPIQLYIHESAGLIQPVGQGGTKLTDLCQLLAQLEKVVLTPVY